LSFTMQSILQYRRIGLAVQKQLDRDREKAVALTTGETVGKDLPLPILAPSAQPPAAISVPPLSRSSTESLEVDTHKDEDNIDTDRSGDIKQTRTQLSQRTALGYALTGIHARDRTTHEGKGSKVFVVGWEGKDDPLNPRNHSTISRVLATLILAMIGFVVIAASSIDTAILPQASAEFGVSEVVESLATGRFAQAYFSPYIQQYLTGYLSIGLFLAGCGVGSMFSGPFSETFGRNIVYIMTMILFMIFIMASALSPNIGAQLAFRFIAGVFGSTPLTCTGGSISDLWDPLEKTYGFPIFAIPSFGGPVLGPVIGSYIGVGHIGSWRWTEWIILITAGIVLSVVSLFQKETYPSLLLKWKAQHLRRLTGDERFRSDLEITGTTLWARLKISLARPFLLITEPIVMFMALYLTVLYIVLFTFLEGFTYIFDETYGIGQGLTNVVFVSMFVGIVFAMLLVPFVYYKTKREVVKNMPESGTHINPEVRLWYAMLGAPAIPISLFWMGWTAYVSCTKHIETRNTDDSVSLPSAYGPQ
jgi:MFS family permease